jgi:phospholipid-binding lipoprotein MlaA
LPRSTLALTSLIAFGFAVSAQAQAPAPPPSPPAASAAQTAGLDLSPARVDPWEKLNRDVFAINGTVDTLAVRPVAVFYKHVTPRPGREGLHNLVANLNQPVIFVNQVLQLKPKRAAGTLGRFALNSTVGVGGVFDVASGAGLPEHATNFGQTLGRYGVVQGPYVYLPVFGPSSVRDAAGKVVDIFLDPINWLRFRDDTYFFTARTVIGGVDARVAVDPVLVYVQKTATDPYATLRSAYLQNAASRANGGKLDVRDLPDFGPEPGPVQPQ